MAAFNLQACFAIDYDFATHRCYFFGSNIAMDVKNMPFLLHCIIMQGVPQPSSLGTRPNPTVVHITFCEFLLSLGHSLTYQNSCPTQRTAA